jgi:hypothetical protein
VLRQMNGWTGASWLPGTDQMKVNGLGISLGMRWAKATRSKSSRLFYYAPEHDNGRTSHFRQVPAGCQQITWRRRDYGFLADLFIEETIRSPSGRVEQPVLAAEVEAYPRHGVRDDIDTNDYQWDFYKLLHVIAPRRLFVACTQKNQLDHLQRALGNAWKRTRHVLPRATDELAIVLLPAGETERAYVRVGTVYGVGELTFTNG